MSSTTHLQLVSVPVSDQDRARSFYVETLGFQLLREQPMGQVSGGSRWPHRAGRRRSRS
jgi:catechol 2,3-dioxygenase-like lactoylglutathione lyase family enzyme